MLPPPPGSPLCAVPAASAWASKDQLHRCRGEQNLPVKSEVTVDWRDEQACAARGQPAWTARPTEETGTSLDQGRPPPPGRTIPARSRRPMSGFICSLPDTTSIGSPENLAAVIGDRHRVGDHRSFARRIESRARTGWSARRSSGACPHSGPATRGARAPPGGQRRRGFRQNGSSASSPWRHSGQPARSFSAAWRWLASRPGRRAGSPRPQPHSLATPNSGTTRLAAAMRR